MKKYYQTLGLNENASLEEAKEARNKLLKKYHPDCYVGNKKIAEMKSAEINEAFMAIVKFVQTRTTINQQTTSTSNTSETKNNAQGYNFTSREPTKEEKARIARNKEKILKKLHKKDEKEKAKEKALQDLTTKDKKNKKVLDFTIYSLILLAIILIIVFAVC